MEEGAYVYQHLNRCSGWEGPRKKGQGFKPDLGNLAVRHYRGLCQEDEKSSCCTKDGGRPSGAALWEEASNSRELLQPKAAVVNVHLCQEDAKASCCTKDGGRPSGAVL